MAGEKKEFLDAEGVVLLWQKIKQLVSEVDTKTQVNSNDILELRELIERYYALEPIDLADLEQLLETM